MTLRRCSTGSQAPTNKLFAVAGTKLYDITDPNSIVEEVTTGITNARWRGVNMNGQGILVNGNDAPSAYRLKRFLGVTRI